MKVEFAYPHTDAAGKTYKPDQAADLEDGLAADLIAVGIARPAEAKAIKAEASDAKKGA